MIVRWDSRNGTSSYPYPHNVTHGWQKCPKCDATLRTLEIAADYVPRRATCKCGAIVDLPGVEDDGRFAGLRQILANSGDAPFWRCGDVPVNCSESVRDEFESIRRCGF
jgi:hypothetical protein